MKPVRQVTLREEIEFFLRLHGLWEELIHLARPPPPPFDIDTMEPIEPPWLAIKEWIPDDEPDLDWCYRPRNQANPDSEGYDQRVLRSLPGLRSYSEVGGEEVSPAWKAPEVQLDDDRILVLEYS